MQNLPRALAAGLIAGGIAGSAMAQQPLPPTPPPPPEHPAIEPQALAILKATSERLVAAHAMSFTAVTTYESPARNGQPLYYATRSDVTMQRPDKLRVITPGDGPASDFYYDGRQMMSRCPKNAGLPTPTRGRWPVVREWASLRSCRTRRRPCCLPPPR